MVLRTNIDQITSNQPTITTIRLLVKSACCLRYVLPFFKQGKRSWLRSKINHHPLQWFWFSRRISIRSHLIDLQRPPLDSSLKALPVWGMYCHFWSMERKIIFVQKILTFQFYDFGFPDESQSDHVRSMRNHHHWIPHWKSLLFEVCFVDFEAWKENSSFFKNWWMNKIVWPTGQSDAI